MGPLDHHLPRVLYIMGTARSGSTILEILLAQADEAFGAGELSHLPHDAWREDLPCSCGRAASSCPTWGEVARELSASGHNTSDWPALFRSIEWHAAFPRLVLGLVPSALRERYGTANDALLASIAKVTGARWVIDSSKYPGRALGLTRIGGRDVAIVALTRSPSGLMSAFTKKNETEQRPKSALQALAYYAWVGSSVRLAGALIDAPVLYVRYEDLTRDPLAVLSQIERFAGLDTSRACRAIEDDTSLDVGHMVTGNRLRKADEVRFRRRSTPPQPPRRLRRRLATAGMAGIQRLLGL